jgi:hypothetical protein
MVKAPGMEWVELENREEQLTDKDSNVCLNNSHSTWCQRIDDDW